MNTIGELIHNKRKELHLTLEEVGKAVGVSKSTVKKWETGYISNMKRDKIALLANILQISPSELIDDTDNNIVSFDNVIPVMKIKLPLLGEIACGKPIFADEQHELYVDVKNDYGADFCLKANGESMINAGIDSGDIVMIKKESMVNNGEIAAVIIDDDATLKRVYYYPEKGKLILNPENPLFEPLVYINEELNTIRIIGKAVAVIKKLWERAFYIYKAK